MKSGVALGNMEVKLLSWAQNRKIAVVRSGDAQKALKISKMQEAKLLYTLSKSGLIAQVRRGLYLVPAMLPPGGKWAPSPYLALDVFMKDAGASAYQITGLAAFNSYGLNTQIPTLMDVYNDKVSGEKTLAGQQYRLIKVEKKRLGFTKDIQIDVDSMKVTTYYSSLPRAIFDAIYDADRFGTLPAAYQWLRDRVKDRRFLSEFVKVCLKIGNVSTLRRVGCVLDELGMSKEAAQFQRKLKQTSAFIPLDPSRPARGRTNSKWGVVVNE